MLMAITRKNRRLPAWPENVPETGLGPDVLMLLMVDQARLRNAEAGQRIVRPASPLPANGQAEGAP
ncbi:hypothetical protein [Amycolatopsis pittospori]|uniref:hypothetical protein n=1 Tax=Amycolatopsis pittospori TaxID=2749434 RepID=UPI0015F03BB9|nr:hypothetical protein [Amycolatopsis pittospori]